MDGFACVRLFSMALSKVFYSRAWILSHSLDDRIYSIYIYIDIIYTVHILCAYRYMLSICGIWHIFGTYTKLVEKQTCILILLCKTCHFRWTWYIREDWNYDFQQSQSVPILSDSCPSPKVAFNKWLVVDTKLGISWWLQNLPKSPTTWVVGACPQRLWMLQGMAVICQMRNVQ